MAKKALCIGINDYPGTNNDLYGCVNDSNDWRAVLEERGFTVQQLRNSEATKDAMYRGMQRLVDEARSGDIVVITYSGHGSWVPDLDDDESDGQDEVLCPYDISQNRPLTDDELYNIVSKQRRGVRIVIISDSCNSGTVIRPYGAVAPAPNLPRTRFLPNGNFLPEDMLQEADERARRPKAGVSRPFGGILLSGCQDNEYSFDAQFNGRMNGAFTYYALEALKSLQAGATYQEWHDLIINSLPSGNYPQNPNLQGPDEQKSWKIFEGGKSMVSTVNPTITPVTSTSSSQQSTGSQPVSSPWVLNGASRQRAFVPSNNRQTTAALADLSDGAYVTAVGRSNALYRIQNGRRQIINPANVGTMSITQANIQLVDPIELGFIPLEETQRRAIGRDVQRYLWSDLQAGHFMQSWVWLRGTELTVRTRTETVTWFGGYTGGVSVILFDADGRRIPHDDIRYRYGVDGRAFGSGWREVTEVYQLPRNVSDAAESIAILHYWDPKVDLVDVSLQVAVFIWELIEIWLRSREQGEQVNAGGEEF
jgi:hypothetical protein